MNAARPDRKEGVRSANADGTATSTGPISVIFLDVDGVLHPLSPKGLPDGATLEELVARQDHEDAHAADPLYVAETLPSEFKADRLALLKRLVDATGAKIVLSSTWRETRSQTLAVNARLLDAGIAGIIGQTPQLPYKPASPMNRRGHEIMAWVTEHRERITGFVVLDDSEFSLGSPALDRQHFPRVDPALALQPASVDRMVACVESGINDDLLAENTERLQLALEPASDSDSDSDS